MYCRNCGKETSPDNEFCLSCGARPQNGKSYCPNCGAPTSELAEICVKCGARLGAPAASRRKPDILPGVSAPYKFGWKVLWPSFWILLAMGIIGFLINGAFGGLTGAVPALGFLSGLVSIFVGIPLSFGQSWCYLRVARDRQVNFEEMFMGFKFYWNSVAAGLLTALIVIGGTILLIVPGIIFACKLAFVPYLVIDRKMGPTEAIQVSWRMTRGHAMEVFLIDLLGLPIMILGAICLGVGMIVAVMWITMAQTALYYAVNDAQPEAPAGGSPIIG